MGRGSIECTRTGLGVGQLVSIWFACHLEEVQAFHQECLELAVLVNEKLLRRQHRINAVHDDLLCWRQMSRDHEGLLK